MSHQKQTSHPKRETLVEMAKRTGISRKTLGEWRKAGIDIHDEKQLTSRIAEMHGGPAGEDLRGTRLRKLKAEAGIAELNLAARRREVVPARDVEFLLTAIGAATKAALRGLEGALPNELEGRHAAEISKILRQHFDEALLSLSEMRLPDE